MGSAANPEQSLQIDAGGSGGMGIECVARINQRANFLALGGRGQGGEHQAGASGRFRAANLGEASAGKAAGQGIDLRDPARRGVGRRADLQTGCWGYASCLLLRLRARRC